MEPLQISRPSKTAFHRFIQNLTRIYSKETSCLLLADITLSAIMRTNPKVLKGSAGGNQNVKCPNPLKSWSSILWPRNSKNSTKAGLSSMFPNSSSSDVCKRESAFPWGVTYEYKEEIGTLLSMRRTHLAELLINNSKLEVVVDHVLIKGDDEPGRLRTRRREVWGQIHGAVCRVVKSQVQVPMRTSAYLWVEDGVKPVHVNFFTNKLQGKKHIEHY